jgi:hypothetical protein
MKRSLLARVGGTVAALALGVTTLATVGAVTPAGAAATVSCTTTVSVRSSYDKLPYGHSNSVWGTATAKCSDGNGGLVPAGSIQLEQSTDGGHSWTPVGAPGTSEANYSHTATRTLLFRSSYTGGSAGSYTFPSGISAPTTLSVVRDVSLTSKKVRVGKPIPVTWKANPGATGIVYAKKPGKKKFKVYKRVAVRSTGTKFKVKLPTGTRLRFVIPGSAGIPTWQFQTRIKRTAF